MTLTFPLSLCTLFVGALLVVLGGVRGVFAQADTLPNLLPNPSFEDFRVRPIGWYYKGAQFDRVIRYWRSPTGASPDAYNPFVRVPAHWQRNGFGEQSAHSGGAMVGLTLYGCSEGKPHCREYVRAQLIEPLVAGQRYRFSVYVASLPRGLQTANLAAAFTDSLARYDDDRRLALRPQVRFAGVTEAAGRWTALSGEFEAAGGEAYVTLGNFDDDATTDTRPGALTPSLPFAYYYLDDVRLERVDPLLPAPVPADDLSRRTLTAGEALTLRGVYFDRDSDELQPRSFVELDKLAGLLARFPARRVRIVGHTDADGTAAYNDDLSQRRAERVVAYLSDRGVAPARLDAEGRGQGEPAADNATGRGRALNRRVVAEVE